MVSRLRAECSQEEAPRLGHMSTKNVYDKYAKNNVALPSAQLYFTVHRRDSTGCHELLFVLPREEMVATIVPHVGGRCK